MSRKRKVLWATFAVIVAGVLATPISVEAWRQSDIHAARTELAAEVAYMTALFDDVPDMQAWVLARTHPSPGHEALRDFADTELSDDLAREILDFQVQFETELLTWLANGSLPQQSPPEAVVNSILELTEIPATRLAALRRYESLAPHRPFVSTPGESRLWQKSSAILQVRAICLAWREQWSPAFETALTWLELASRLRGGAALLQVYDDARLFGAAMELCIKLAPRATIDANQARRLGAASVPWSIDLAELIRADFAELTLKHRGGTEPWSMGIGLYDSRQYDGWFEWWSGTDQSKDALLERFHQASSVAREVAAMLRPLRPVVDALRARTDLPRGLGPYNHLRDNLGLGWQRLASQRLGAMAELRLRQADGEDWALLTLSAANWPDVSASRDGDTIVLDFRRADEVLRATGFETWDALEANLPPSRLSR